MPNWLLMLELSLLQWEVLFPSSMLKEKLRLWNTGLAWRGGEGSVLGDASRGSVFVLKDLIFYAFSFFSSLPGRIILAHSDSRFGPSKNCSAEHGMAALFTRSLDVPLH